jgi:hypothetical protein
VFFEVDVYVEDMVWENGRLIGLVVELGMGY